MCTYGVEKERLGMIINPFLRGKIIIKAPSLLRNSFHDDKNAVKGSVSLLGYWDLNLSLPASQCWSLEIHPQPSLRNFDN